LSQQPQNVSSFALDTTQGRKKEEEERKNYLPKRLIARKGFSPSTLATKHTIKHKQTKYTQTLRVETTKSKSSV